jgi:hypothetical protein
MEMSGKIYAPVTLLLGKPRYSSDWRLSGPQRKSGRYREVEFLPLPELESGSAVGSEFEP